MGLVEHLKWVRDKKKHFMTSMNRMNIIQANCKFSLFIQVWNSWYNAHHNINETIVRQTADAIVATGLAAAGYQYGMYFSLFYTYK